MKKLIFIVTILLSVSSMAVLLPAPKDVRNSLSQLEVRPPLRFLDCEECQNPYMGGIKGAGIKDIELTNYHLSQIYGLDADQNTKAKSTE